MLSVLTILCFLLLTATLFGVYRYRFTSVPAESSELPTVSLLIPARNETHAVSRSLDAALALDYPKLEIIVLDDQSQDNTSEKIRSFAQNGVRFLEGRPLPAGWIGKNWACHQLAKAASGQYLIFCDMDVRLSSEAIVKLGGYLQAKSLSGCSVMPSLWLADRLQAVYMPFLTWLTQLLFLSLAKLRPAYGGLMLFEASAYRSHGGYRRYFDDVLPEFSLAADFSKRSGFRFFTQSDALPVLLHKKPSSLNETRLRYLSKLYRKSLLAGCLHTILLLLPLAVILLKPILYPIILLSYVAAMRKHANHWFWQALLLPAACAWELHLLIRSVLQYKSGRVTWKNRRV